MSKRVLDEAAIAWRSAVLSRDNGACVQCGATKWLHAHHIKPYAEHEESRYDVANGETLCRDCHSKKHPKQEQLILSVKRPRRPSPGVRRCFNMSDRHESLLLSLSSKMGIQPVDVAARALEALELREAQRDKLVMGL